MLSEGRDIVALVDGDKSGEDTEGNLKKVCEKELKDKKLQIYKLPKGKSTEDIFTNNDTLKESIIHGGLPPLGRNQKTQKRRKS